MGIRNFAWRAALQIPQVQHLQKEAAQLREQNERLSGRLSKAAEARKSAREELKQKRQEARRLASDHRALQAEVEQLRKSQTHTPLDRLHNDVLERLSAIGQAQIPALLERLSAIGQAQIPALLERLSAIGQAQIPALLERLSAIEQAQIPILGQFRNLETSLELSQSRLLSHLSLLQGEAQTIRKMLRAEQQSEGIGLASARLLYLDLLETALTGRLYEDEPISPWNKGYDPTVRMMGRDWPSHAQTMIGTARMRNIRMLSESIIEDNINGSFLEAGVWRGGACIYMRGILAAYDVTDRTVWVADSFAGLPPPNPDLYPADRDDPHHTFAQLAVSLDEVKSNFAKYNLLDEQVQFLPGWFKDTLPSAPIERLALIRLDGDMYESTIQALDATYAKLSPGGYIIIDDYILPACREAVTDFRRDHSIDEPIQEIDGAGVYWRKRR